MPDPDAATTEPWRDALNQAIYDAGYEASEAEAAARERQRIRAAVAACLDCGKPHQPRDTGHGHITWADPDDGHVYAPRLSDRARKALAVLLDGDGDAR